ncbi:hypothetical protein [Streptomyces sp. NPDC014734]|uniref:hypothetical protein n=1 Tax=Streptomyces sp. NPDC014734 TaxID=3364886 RepID=UPI0036F82FFE
MRTGSGVCSGSLRLYAATFLPGFCGLSAHQDEGTGVTPVAKGCDAPAILGDAAPAYLVHVRIRYGDKPCRQGMVLQTTVEYCGEGP